MVDQIPLDQVSIILYFVVFALGFTLGMVRRGISSNGAPQTTQPPPPAYPPGQMYMPQHIQHVQNQPVIHKPQPIVQHQPAQPVHNIQNGRGGLSSTAYMALAELAGCKGVIVVEKGRVLCVESDDKARVVWSLEGGSGGA